MRKKVENVAVLLCATLLMCACGGTKNVDEGQSFVLESPAGTSVESEQDVTTDAEDQISDLPEVSEAYSEEQAFEAVRNYYISITPGYEDSNETGDYWDVSTNEKGEIVVLYHSYTGAINRYYVDATTGDTYVTEQVPGIIDDEQETGETFNIKDYLESAE